MAKYNVVAENQALYYRVCGIIYPWMGLYTGWRRACFARKTSVMATSSSSRSRKLTVCSSGNRNTFDYVFFPEIRLRGQWLKAIGFESGQVITIECSHREIIIRTDGTRRYNEQGERIG